MKPNYNKLYTQMATPAGCYRSHYFLLLRSHSIPIRCGLIFKSQFTQRKENQDVNTRGIKARYKAIYRTRKAVDKRNELRTMYDEQGGWADELESIWDW